MKRPHRLALLGSLLVLGAFAMHGCGGSNDKKNPVAPPATADITINIVADAGSSAFGASATTVTAGQTVSWHNTRGTTHTATGGSFNTGNIAPGTTSAPITISTVGDLPYACNIHPSMTGTLHVVP